MGQVARPDSLYKQQQAERHAFLDFEYLAFSLELRKYWRPGGRAANTCRSTPVKGIYNGTQIARPSTKRTAAGRMAYQQQ